MINRMAIVGDRAGSPVDAFARREQRAPGVREEECLR
jgi:hypothetical protein